MSVCQIKLMTGQVKYKNNNYERNLVPKDRRNTNLYEVRQLIAILVGVAK